MNLLKKCKKIAGPGVITGAADNDPSGIATYSQAGAQFGYTQLWAMLFLLPLQTAIQDACARIGAVTGKGLAANIKSLYGTRFLYGLVLLLLIANIINIGADIGAMAAVIQLILPLNFVFLTVALTIIILLLEILVPYKKYARLLKYLTLFLLAYPFTLFMINAPWKKVLASTFIPHIEFNFHFLFILTGLLGTTISPYLFFWQASQEIEEEKEKGLLTKNHAPNISAKLMKQIRIDNFLGMLLSQICAWSIIVVAATVLNANGIHYVETAADAAKALEPFAGPYAKLFFSVGVLGLGLLSIPILAGSSAYACCETFKWQLGLNKKWKRAPYFYLIIILSTLIGLSMNFIGIDPMKALVYAAVINGMTAVPLIFIVIFIANKSRIMHQYKSGLIANTLLWLTFICMALTAISVCLAFIL